ncbi:sulfotransferase family 2 domain-containing protein [Xanthobacter tagetidis]|uniref:Sulfotransferase family protein n=1 Tax=Xanthobacter tagetidis TaxID=60216 RepID=A0A3L7A7C9_9HYPH|nr:sulfotransferase family 2 domain-containing protein [Xanthobacter tagetidis]MBB6308355.1 hypothetical protein [Xanthobacter tagetidis]RLP76223.1 hypothetical protein D9R14_15520 [Xanthobacter tagetidis]
MPINRDDVVAGYRFILGRDPESDAAIGAHSDLPDIATLRRRLMSSREFLERHALDLDPRDATDADPERPAVVFLHIPKCAGTSLHMALMAHFADTACPERHNGLANWPAGALGRCRFFSGHFDFPSLRLIPGHKVSVVTLLRRPAERLVSLYRFLRAHPPAAAAADGAGGRLAALARRLDPVAFFRHEALARHPAINNAIVRQLSGPLPQKRWDALDPAAAYGAAPADRAPEQALATAQINLMTMAAFGLVEHMDLSVARIFAALGLPAPGSIAHFQVTDRIAQEHPALEAVDPVPLGPALAEALAPHTTLDDRLYAAAAARFGTAAAAAPRTEAVA